MPFCKKSLYFYHRNQFNRETANKEMEFESSTYEHHVQFHYNLQNKYFTEKRENYYVPYFKDFLKPWLVDIADCENFEKSKQIYLTTQVCIFICNLKHLQTIKKKHVIILTFCQWMNFLLFSIIFFFLSSFNYFQMT